MRKITINLEADPAEYWGCEHWNGSVVRLKGNTGHFFDPKEPDMGWMNYGKSSLSALRMLIREKSLGDDYYYKTTKPEGAP